MIKHHITLIKILRTSVEKKHQATYYFQRGSRFRTIKSMDINKKIDPILLAEDNDGLVESITIMLNREGYEVLAAPTGDQAYKILEERLDKFGSARISMVLSDFNMPDGWGGIELLLSIRKSKDFSKLPFVIMSGTAKFDEMASDVAGKDISGILIKPFRKVELMEKLQNVIGFAKEA